MPDQFNFSQLTKEMIVSRLKEATNAPSVAAEIAKKTIIAGVQSTRERGQSPRETVVEICLGAMSGLLIIEKDLPKGAVQLLRCMAEVAHELNLDPSELMTWAMEGIARITKLIAHETTYDIRQAIEDEYQGAGDIFIQLCSQHGKQP